MFDVSLLTKKCMLLLVTMSVFLNGTNGIQSYTKGDSNLQSDENLRVNPGQDKQSEVTQSSKSREHYKELPDSPVQLVCPDPNTHRQLVVIEENIKLLQNIQGSVATIAVVGKFHSGKSFLLNQMMGKQSGFGVGPFVRPQTMGIWMWGKPKKTVLPNGEEVSLIFLDTEGFAATNVSESYDARIFAVATLLSSYLVYNSVKIIDQGDIDYLELLARRTQLFALKSQMSKAKWTDEFNHDLLTFPPLMWMVTIKLIKSLNEMTHGYCAQVVQDFVQSTENDETPTEWLLRLLSSSAKESEEHQISLRAIFPSVDCHTLFLPATRRSLLQDLSKAQEEDLTTEYKAERDELIRVLLKGLQPKEKNGRPLNGPELASLLEILVEAANEGSLAQIPNRWSSFIERLEKTAKEDCFLFYEAEMAVIHKKYDNGPVPEPSFKEWHKNSRSKALKLLTHLLFGLGSVVNDSSRGLLRKLEESFEKALDLNDKKIKLKCGEVQSHAELECEEELEKIALPVKPVALIKQCEKAENDAISKYRVSLDGLADSEAFQQYLEKLKTTLRNLRASYTLKNNRAIEILLDKALNAAVGVFEEHVENKNRHPRTPKVLAKILQNAEEEAKQVFHAESSEVQERNCCERHLLLLKARLSERIEISHQKNKELVRIQADAKVRELLGLFRTATDSSHISLPLNETDLEKRLKSEVDKIQKSFWNSQLGFETFDVVSHCFQDLKSFVKEVCDQRRHENMVAYSKEVETPLKMSKKIVLLSADSYDTEFSITQYIRQVCLLNLDEGKPKYWSMNLKNTIIENYILTDQELRKMVLSRRGWWKRLKGFFQWLLWKFNLYT